MQLFRAEDGFKGDGGIRGIVALRRGGVDHAYLSSGKCRLRHIPTNNPGWLFGISALLGYIWFNLFVLYAFTKLQRAIGPYFKLLADIVRYIGLPEYRTAIHSELSTTLATVVNGDCECLVIVGHSLGSVIAIQHLMSNPAVFGTVKRIVLITLGSPIRRLLYRFFPELYPSPDELARTVEGELHVQGTDFSWINVYRLLDPLGSRLGRQQHSIIQDRRLCELTKSHTNYWNDRLVTQTVIQALRDSTCSPLEVRPERLAPVIWPDQKCRLLFSGFAGRLWEKRADCLLWLGVRGRRIATVWLLACIFLWYVLAPRALKDPTIPLRFAWITLCTICMLLYYNLMWWTISYPFFSATLGILRAPPATGGTSAQAPAEPVPRARGMFIAGLLVLSGLLVGILFVNGLYDRNMWQQTANLPGKGLLVAFSADGKLLGVSGELNLYLWSITSEGTLVPKGDPVPLPSRDVLLSPDLNNIAWISGDQISVSDLVHQGPTICLPLPKGAPRAIALGGGGKYLALLSEDRPEAIPRLLVIDTYSKTAILDTNVVPDSHYLLTFSPDNRSLALATPTRVLHFKVEHEPLRSSSDLSVDPFVIACSRNCGYIAVASVKGLEIYDVGRNRQIASMDGAHNYLVLEANGLAFSPDGETLAMVADTGITLWKWRHRRYLGFGGK